MAVLHCSVPPVQAWRVPLLCIQRQQGVSTILACACWWHCAAQICETVTALCFVDTGLDTGARWIPADVRPRESAVALDVGLGGGRFFSRLKRRFRQGKTCSVPVLALTERTNPVALTSMSVRT